MAQSSVNPGIRPGALMGNAGPPVTAASSSSPSPTRAPASRLTPSLGNGSTPPLHSHVATLVSLILGADDAAPNEYVAAVAAGGYGIDLLYLELVAPAAIRLGEMWKDDTCDFVDVTVGVGRLQRIVRSLGHEFGASPAEAGSARILLTCVSGEQHTLGMFLVAEFFLKDGWNVRMGAPVDGAELIATMRSGYFDVVGFSVACDSNLARLRRDIASVRRHSQNRRIAVLVGGRSFNENPALVDRVDADGTALDARGATVAARRLLGWDLLA